MKLQEIRENLLEEIREELLEIREELQEIREGSGRSWRFCWRRQ